MKFARHCLGLLLAAGLVACVGSRDHRPQSPAPHARPHQTRPAQTRPPQTRPAPHRPAAQPARPVTPPDPPPTHIRGQAASLAGLSSSALIASLGQPRMTRHEGSAVMMQFAGRSCVLDVYLYPPSRGAAVQVAHTDARATNGRDMDRQGCITALQQR